MDIKDRALELLRAEPSISTRALAKRLGVPESSSRAAIRAAREQLAATPKEDPMAVKLPTVDPATLEVGPPFSDLFVIDPGILAAIEESMVRDGFHASKPIEVWKGRNLVVDGHTRRQAAINAGIEVAVYAIDFEDEDEALAHAIASQRVRRNMTDADILRCIEAVDRRRRKGEKAPTGAYQGNSAEATAKIVGTSKKQVERARKVLDAGPEARGEVLAGRSTIFAAAEKVRKARSVVNGHAGEDPPDVAMARANGKIPEGVEVKVDDPGPTTPEPAPPPAEKTDEEWTAELPLHAQLAGVCLKTFVEDAILYRHLESYRSTYQHHANRALKGRRFEGAYGYIVSRFLKRDHPKHWLLCPATEEGGCGATGQIPEVGTCPKCRGRGYYIK